MTMHLLPADPLVRSWLLSLVLMLAAAVLLAVLWVAVSGWPPQLPADAPARVSGW